MTMAKLGIGNNIHPTAIIGPDVILGNDNYIGPYCVLTGKLTIGNNNRFESYCSVGTPAECIGYFDTNIGITTIGNHNIFREFVTINAGSTKQTIINDNIIMLRGSHIGHDSIIENNSNISCNVLIGGYSYIMEGANLGLGTICHQFSKIGAYSMIGMGTIVTKKTLIKPAGVYYGCPARWKEYNQFGLDKYNITEEMLNELINKYNMLTLTR